MKLVPTEVADFALPKKLRVAHAYEPAYQLDRPPEKTKAALEGGLRLQLVPRRGGSGTF